MDIPRRISISLIATLVVLSSSAFLFPAEASAQSLDQNQETIQQLSKKKAEKSTKLSQTTQQVEELTLKKQTLAQQLEEAKKQVDDLNQKLADKKAAAEAEAARVKALQDMFVHVNLYGGDSAGNLYSPGNCTWYVKNKRPDLPNNLGNANTWYARAQAQGWNVGYAPKKGAAGMARYGMHVVYIEGVSLDGSTVTLSEMNSRGLYTMNTRQAPASDFLYIYELN